MRSPPEGVPVRNSYTQDDIEEAFDTGFRYQISGIDPRRDNQDKQYVLFFANEDGPYSDSVTQGRFEYIAEGLSGDQSKSLPGNSVMIDATSLGIPVHFFYQDAGDGQWESQGLVDVLDWEFEERDGREMIVFSMKHLE